MILLLYVESDFLFKIRELKYSLMVSKPLRKYCEPIWKVKIFHVEKISLVSSFHSLKAKLSSRKFLEV